MKKIILFYIIFSLSFIWTMSAQADTLSDMKNKKATVSNKIDSLNKKEKKIKQQIEAKKGEKQSLLDAQKKNTKEYQELQAKKAYLEEQQKLIDADLAESEQKYNSQKDLLKKRLKVMYENSSISYIDTLLQSKSIVDFFNRMQLISIIAKSDKELVTSLEAAKKDVEFKKNANDEAKRDTETKANAKSKTISQISISRSNIENDLQQYQSTLDELQKQEDELSRQSEQINQELKRMMSKQKYSGGIMKWPVPSSSIVTSPFGMRFHPILKKNELHTGVDIGARRGVSIVAAAKGTVIFAGWKTGYGNTVIIDHGGGIATLYGHASKLLVCEGERVSAGQTIAKVGSTGWSTGPHLHFEVRQNGTPKNPLRYITSR